MGPRREHRITDGIDAITDATKYLRAPQSLKSQRSERIMSAERHGERITASDT
jgi:hypothetical protein